MLPIEAFSRHSGKRLHFKRAKGAVVTLELFATTQDHARGQNASHQQRPDRQFVVGLQTDQHGLNDFRHVRLPSLCMLKIDRYPDARWMPI